MHKIKDTFSLQTLLIALISCLSLTGVAGKLPFVHSLFTDHMVLQRDVSCPVWGWTSPGDKITVSFAGQTKETTADNSGRWEVKLDPMPANSKGQELVINSQKNKAEFKDVLVGDVWLCSGQSNMAMGIKGVNQWWNELPGSPVNGIRIFWVQTNPCFKKQSNVLAGKWQVASRHSLQKIKSPYTSVAFSAIAWFYGRALHRETGIPIGLIESSQGNTAIQPWSTLPSLKKSKRYSTPELSSLTGYEEMITKWAQKSDPAWPETKKWISPDFDDQDWKTIKLPRDWSKKILPDFKGIVWFRRHVKLPEDWNGKSLILNLGPVRDQTAVWFNGRFIGGQDHTRRNVRGKTIENIFDVPADAVKKGDNVIVVRILGRHGLDGKPDRLFLSCPGTSGKVSLTGNWLFHKSTPFRKLKGRSRQPDRIWAPGALYNGMIAPLCPFAIKGAIWYQGEGNAGQRTYGKELTDMITDWRTDFRVGDFPFYIVQLAGFGKLRAEPYNSGWAITRELQAKVAKDVPNCGLAVSIDRGEVYDIHPPNKRDVGERLALVALAKNYGKKVVFEGPTYRLMKVEGNKVKIMFDHAEGLKSVGGGPAGIAIAGADKKFVWAQAKIDGETLIVWSPQISKPVAVRYAWGDNTMCNLYNQSNLPAVPFRTDEW